MTSITKTLIFHLKRIANFIALEGENKECYWYGLTLTIYALHWRFVNETIARKSADKIYSMFCDYKEQQDFIGMDMARKFLEMGFTRSRRYANHPSGKKYASDGSVSPQSPTALHCEKSRSATVFKKVRDKAAYDEKYVIMRKEWRSQE